MRFSRLPALLRLLSVPRWATPTITALGCLSAGLESLTLLTFIPLFQTLTNPVSASPSENGTAHKLVLILATMIALVFTKNAVDLLGTYWMKRLEGAATHRLRAEILAATFISSAERTALSSRNDLINMIATDSWRVGSALVFSWKMITAAITALALLATMAVISATLTGLALMFLCLVLTGVRTTSRVADRLGRQVVDENRRFGERMVENLTSLQLIRSFSRERYEIGRFEAISDQLRLRMLHLDLLWSIPGAMTEVSTVILLAGLILAGSMLGTAIPVLAAFLTLLYRLQGPARAVLECKLGIDGLIGAVDDVSGFLQRADVSPIANGSRHATPLRQQIRFENVWFRYHPDGPWALRDVSFTIEAGEMTGIVGGSGAGKSTLMALLFRFHDTTEGRILIDGEPLISLDIASWRAQLALMAQDVHLFSDTIFSNIAYGDLDATPEAVRHAARTAGIDEFVDSLPDGYETQVGTAGFRLSGGQRQRVALARAILKHPSVLLLDEATNALDADAEDRFRKALAVFSADRTVIAIAHRLSTTFSAAKVIVLEHGSVVEIGPPQQLLNRGGRFAELHELQHSRAWETEVHD